MGDAKRSGFLPRVPWLYVGGVGLLLGLVVFGFNWRQQQRAAALREEIRRVHTHELRGMREEYSAALGRLHGLIVEAARVPVTPGGESGSGTFEFVASGWSFQGLHEQPGLYLRVPIEAAASAAQIAAAALQMEPDWIPSCLGWNPTTARELYEIGAFLQPEFIAHLDDENLLKLRVREETLNQRMTKDRAGLEAAMRAPWFMLVLQEGNSRSDDLVRVFLWNLREDKLVLRARARAQGILLTSRILSQGVETERGKPAEGGAAQANDCSIASALKRLSAPPTAAGQP